MESPRIIRLESVASTNTWLSANALLLPDFTIVEAISQPAGRGQRGNSWESEPGKNLTVSMLFRPVADLAAADQFSISEATALAVADTLSEFGITAMIKWPNDIYVGERKICGILIEHSLIGSGITHSILGIGLNVNQTRFLSDAPNPVSMNNITGLEYDTDHVRDSLARALQARLGRTAITEGRKELHREFTDRLWRGDGKPYPFIDNLTGERFQATIDHVEPRGMLCLSPGNRRYAFKEVTFVLK